MVARVAIMLNRGTVFHSQFQYDSAPTSTLQTNVKATGAFEPDDIWVHPGIEHLVGRKDHHERRVKRITAYFVRAAFRKQVPSPIKIEPVPNLVVTVAAMRFDHFEDDGLVLQDGTSSQDILIPGILPEGFHFPVCISQMPLGNFPHSFINCHFELL
jgi:hypothetical protein